MGTSQSISDGSMLICFTAKSSRHTDRSKGNATMGTSQSSSDDYELMCFTAKSLSHHCFLKRERARAPVMALCSFASLQRARAITACSRGNAQMGMSQNTSDCMWLLICNDALNPSHHWQLERERNDGNVTAAVPVMARAFHLQRCSEPELPLAAEKGTSQ
jgi:hypothetical protein